MGLFGRPPRANQTSHRSPAPSSFLGLGRTLHLPSAWWNKVMRGEARSTLFLIRSVGSDRLSSAGRFEWLLVVGGLKRVVFQPSATARRDTTSILKESTDEVLCPCGPLLPPQARHIYAFGLKAVCPELNVMKCVWDRGPGSLSHWLLTAPACVTRGHTLLWWRKKGVRWWPKPGGFLNPPVPPNKEGVNRNSQSRQLLNALE